MFNFLQRIIYNKPKVITSKGLIRPSFRMATADGLVIHSGMPVKYTDGTARLSTVCDKTFGFLSDHSISTKVENELGECMGSYTYTIEPFERIIKNGLIKTKAPFRHKGIGELMRLSSLMELNENGINAIEIDSLPEAIPFHAKYKFQPNLKSKNGSIAILGRILDAPCVSHRFKEDAKDLINRLVKSHSMFNLNEDDAKRVNRYISNYIKTYSEIWEGANFFQHLPMILTKEKVKEFASFYNKLMQKHGIDYII